VALPKTDMETGYLFKGNKTHLTLERNWTKL